MNRMFEFVRLYEYTNVVDGRELQGGTMVHKFGEETGKKVPNVSVYEAAVTLGLDGWEMVQVERDTQIMYPVIFMQREVE